ncbi:MAG: SRPBCC domain-containing protein [Chloroflexota bacterium]
MLSDLVHEVEITAEPAAIYKAIITHEGVASFWVTDNAIEPTVGSEAQFRFKGAPVPLRMRIDALEPNRRVHWTCLGDFPGWRDTTVTWTLGPGSGAGTTKLEFRMGNLAAYPEQAVGEVNYTWGQVVARLKGYAETGKPQPYLP